MCCSVLQCVAMCCSEMQSVAAPGGKPNNVAVLKKKEVQHTTTHYKTLQHTTNPNNVAVQQGKNATHTTTPNNVAVWQGHTATHTTTQTTLLCGKKEVQHTTTLCSTLPHTTTHYKTHLEASQTMLPCGKKWSSMPLQCVAVCCSVLQCVAVCCSVLPCVAVRCRVLQHLEASQTMLPCGKKCSSMPLQSTAFGLICDTLNNFFFWNQNLKKIKKEMQLHASAVYCLRVDDMWHLKQGLFFWIKIKKESKKNAAPCLCSLLLLGWWCATSQTRENKIKNQNQKRIPKKNGTRSIAPHRNRFQHTSLSACLVVLISLASVFPIILLQCVAERCSEWSRWSASCIEICVFADCCSVVQCVAVCRCVLQCVVVCCSVLQCAAVYSQV